MLDLIEWLRSTIEGDKAKAEALPHGPWHVSGVLDGYPQRVTNDQAIVIAHTYTGPEHEPDIANYIATHDARDTIARCESELALLRNYEGLAAAWPTIEHMGSDWAPGRIAGAIQVGVMKGVVQTIARGYRHRDGYPGDALE